jgi:hypothetical protein
MVHSLRKFRANCIACDSKILKKKKKKKKWITAKIARYTLLKDIEISKKIFHSVHRDKTPQV